jgi:hypothetical protein
MAVMSAKTSGAVLTAADVDDIATRIVEMWDNYNTDRRNALMMSDEARQYIFATDIDSTSANIQPHKNRTHQPKLTQISDNLQSQYWDATLSMPNFFKFDGSTDEDKVKAPTIEAVLQTKLEQKKFRETVGRALLADFTNYGNAFAVVDYVHEKDATGRTIYKGPCAYRVSPLDIVFNPRAVSFYKSPKIVRHLIHIAEIAELAETYPNGEFDKACIEKCLMARTDSVVNDWVEVLKEKGLKIDGFASYNEYFKQDMVEVLVYRGDIFNPETGKSQRNRIIYVVDRTFVIKNSLNKSRTGYDGLHHAGWRTRNDNLWAQGPLDNIVGMQYRIDHLENLKADVFDLIAHPVVKIKGDNVQEPEEGFGPNAVYYCGLDEDVEILSPETAALNADNQIEVYHRKMEEFAGAPPESRGLRTPGEKTAFEVNKLDANATKMFVDKARMFEIMLENMLQDMLHILVKNFDGEDIYKIKDSALGVETFKELSEDEISAVGNFIAVGASYWSRRNRETVEMREFQLGPMQDPKIRAHVSGERLASFYEARLGLQDENIIEPFAGVREDVAIQMIAKAEADRLAKEVGMTNEPNVSQDNGVATVQPTEIQGGNQPAKVQPGTAGIPPMV